jgi:hypothetical protein
MFLNRKKQGLSLKNNSLTVSLHYKRKGLLKGIVQRNLTGVGSNDKFSVAVLGFNFDFWKDTILDSAKNALPLVKPEMFKFSANSRRCCKWHVAPYDLFVNSISTN